ncbi:MAG: autotransporter domain-containing protein [Desulfovibrio sp.]|nr:autotransporter domain-containing protein [Desulfovibrio sp.]
MTDAEYASLFGMGIVNAGNAVRGPGWLDANRLENGDVQSYDGTNSYAMYPVDTKGFNAVWSNDIQEVKVGDATYPGYTFGPYADPDFVDKYYGLLTGKSVGLLKSGEGTLTLSGSNEYTGPTVVAGGTIRLGTPEQRDGAAKLAGSVIVGRDGAFLGNGDVVGDLQFAGTVSPGLRSTPGSVLRVNGNVVGEVAGTSKDSESLAGKGTLFLNVWGDGRANLLSAGGNVNLEEAQVAISGMSGGAMPAASFLLAKADAGSTVTLPANEAATSKQGVTLLHNYRFALSPDGSGLVANHAGTTVLPETKALSEGRLAGLTILDIGADLIAGQGIDAAKDSLWTDGDAGRGEGMRLNSFAALSVGSSRYETGSHVDVRSMSLMAGLAIGSDIPLGRLVLGAFFEFGEGSYDTYNSFPGRTSVSGAGNANHLGGGVLGSLEFRRFGPGLPHVEASARAGRLRNGYSSSDLVDFEGESAEYDADTPYFGWHVGAGYAWDICDDFSLDLYGRYLSTRQYGKSITLSTGDPIKFEDAVSSRMRLGGRLAWEGGEVARPYVGLAWDREFDGRQRASTNGFDLDVPSTKGDTGVAEIGLAIRPSAKRPLTVDLALQGYAGVRRGISGSLQIMFEF